MTPITQAEAEDRLYEFAAKQTHTTGNGRTLRIGEMDVDHLHRTIRSKRGHHSVALYEIVLAYKIREASNAEI